MTMPPDASVPPGGEVLFEDVFLGGFECSCHRLEDGRRLDLAATTRHREFADADYARLRRMGMTACRDGISWIHAARRGGYDFAQALPMVRAAERHGVRVIWDLMHFGWPDDVDVFAPSFPSRFALYARTFARWLTRESDQVPFIAPINEMSFLAWAGGDVRCMNPFQAARGVELKAQLVRACIEAIEGIRTIAPRARFLQPEPVIQIVPDLEKPKTWRRVESDNLLQYQAWAMLTGEQWPSLGGHPKYLDVIGVNFYSDNQFMLDGTTILRDDVRYKPFYKMLLEVYQRFRRPMIVSETGSEGDHRAPWLRYVAGQCVMAIRRGCELHGITLYPIVSYPGWADGRHCHNGLWDYADDTGGRSIDEPLARELVRQRGPLMVARARMLRPACNESGTVAV
jgi:beta-glucosidase/6-phospho-beta-glucosidase/beta-galactosidase